MLGRSSHLHGKLQNPAQVASSDSSCCALCHLIVRKCLGSTSESRSSNFLMLIYCTRRIVALLPKKVWPTWIIISGWIVGLWKLTNSELLKSSPILVLSKIKHPRKGTACEEKVKRRTGPNMAHIFHPKWSRWGPERNHFLIQEKKGREEYNKWNPSTGVGKTMESVYFLTRSFIIRQWEKEQM